MDQAATVQKQIDREFAPVEGESYFDKVKREYKKKAAMEERL